jgi:hypothetical protein
MSLDSYLVGLSKTRLCGSEYEAGNEIVEVVKESRGVETF